MNAAERNAVRQNLRVLSVRQAERIGGHGQRVRHGGKAGETVGREGAEALGGVIASL